MKGYKRWCFNHMQLWLCPIRHTRRCLWAEYHRGFTPCYCTILLPVGESAATKSAEHGDPDLTWAESVRLHGSHQSLTVPVGLRLRLWLAWLCWFWGVGLQLFQLLNKQCQVLEQVPVLQQQLVDTGLSLHTGGTLCCHLILQQLHLMWKHRATSVWLCVKSLHLTNM